MIRVLVCDDHELTRRSIGAVLEPEGDIEVVAYAGDGAAAVAAASACAPDVVLMDIRMPRLDGVEATRRITALPDPPAVLVLTTYETDEHVFETLRAGASGFLLKDVAPEGLVDAVRVVAGGDAMLAPTVTRRLIREVTARAPRTALPAAAGLTARESEVLGLVAEGLSNGQIATRLGVAETTVKTHVSRLLAKLGARSRSQAVALAHQAGLVGG